MARIGEVTVDIATRVTVDKKTADFCLKMVEKYVNDTGAMILVNSNDNGEIKYEFIERKAPTEEVSE